ncbi:MAG: HPr family phosphocarrier protein [Acutalibacteraceae bacterium]
MVSKKVTVINAQGFHMRPATVFAGEMGKFKAKISLEANGKTVDGKSLMNIIAACIKCGSEVLVSCDGEDENEMLEKAVSLIESGLGE